MGEFYIQNYFYFKLWVFYSLDEKFDPSYYDKCIKI